jgi:hypothetical protein
MGGLLAQRGGGIFPKCADLRLAQPNGRTAQVVLIDSVSTACHLPGITQYCYWPVNSWQHGINFNGQVKCLRTCREPVVALLMDCVTWCLLA